MNKKSYIIFVILLLKAPLSLAYEWPWEKVERVEKEEKRKNKERKIQELKDWEEYKVLIKPCFKYALRITRVPETLDNYYGILGNRSPFSKTSGGYILWFRYSNSDGSYRATCYVDNYGNVIDFKKT